MKRLVSIVLASVLSLAFPALSMAQKPDSTSLKALDGRLEEYFKTLEPERIEVKERECDILIESAELELAVVVFVKDIEIIALHERVGEFQEGKARFKTHLDGFVGEHARDGEEGADVAEEFKQIQVAEPRGVVEEERLPVGEIQESGELLFEAGDVFIDGLDGHDGARGGLAGRISDHGGSAADEGDGAMPALLEPTHAHDGKEMPDVEAAAGGIEADVESRGAFFESFAHGGFIGHLVKESAFFQDV